MPLNHIANEPGSLCCLLQLFLAEGPFKRDQAIISSYVRCSKEATEDSEEVVRNGVPFVVTDHQSMASQFVHARQKLDRLLLSQVMEKMGTGDKIKRLIQNGRQKGIGAERVKIAVGCKFIPEKSQMPVLIFQGKYLSF